VSLLEREDFLEDSPTVETGGDEAQKFATYWTYLLSLSKFIKAEYAAEPRCFSDFAKSPDCVPWVDTLNERVWSIPRYRDGTDQRLKTPDR
jgi:hypothetical protein